MAGGSFAVSKLVWQWSVVAEVFSFNNLFVGVLFSLLACFHNAESMAQKTKVMTHTVPLSNCVNFKLDFSEVL